MPLTPEQLQLAVRTLKKRFLAWCDPPIELPAESVIESTLREIISDLETPRTQYGIPCHPDTPDWSKVLCACGHSSDGHTRNNISCPQCGCNASRSRAEDCTFAACGACGHSCAHIEQCAEDGCTCKEWKDSK